MIKPYKMKQNFQNGALTTTKATLIGLIAIILWSALVALIKSVSDSFGPIGGAALIYSLATAFLLVTIGFPKLKTFPKKYLWVGSILFVVYEICLSLAIGYAHDGRQAIEVGMINYLWPTFTIIASIIFNKQRASYLVIPGFILSILGIFWVLGNGKAFDLPLMLANMQDNPISYFLAFLGALVWSAYCVVAVRIAEGKNGITFFFMLVAITLWLQYFIMGKSDFNFTIQSVIYLLLAASAMGFGYAAWNVGMLHGNVIVLATASYFIPIFSAFIAAIMLNTSLSFGFWQGVIMVCAGSILCYLSTKKR